jgi:hypothetical protein
MNEEGTRRARHAAQDLVQRVSDLRRAIETTPQPDRVLAGIVAKSLFNNRAPTTYPGHGHQDRIRLNP